MRPHDVSKQRFAHRPNTLVRSPEFHGAPTPTHRYHEHRDSRLMNSKRNSHSVLGVDNLSSPPSKLRRVEHDLRINSQSKSRQPYTSNARFGAKLSDSRLPHVHAHNRMKSSRIRKDAEIHHKLGGTKSLDTKAVLRKEKGTLPGQTSIMPFIIEDDSEDEIVVATQKHRFWHQPQPSGSVMRKQDEHRQSQALRAKAMQKKRGSDRSLTPESPDETVNVIDLCSPKSLSPEICVQQKRKPVLPQDDRPNGQTIRKSDIPRDFVKTLNNAQGVQTRYIDVKCPIKLPDWEQKSENIRRQRPHQQVLLETGIAQKKINNGHQPIEVLQTNAQLDDVQVQPKKVTVEWNSQQHGIIRTSHHDERFTTDPSMLTSNRSQTLQSTDSDFDFESFVSVVSSQHCSDSRKVEEVVRDAPAVCRKVESEPKQQLSAPGAERDTLTHDSHDWPQKESIHAGEQDNPSFGDISGARVQIKPSKSTKIIDEQQQRKDERIQKMKMRNQRNRGSSHEHETDEEETADPLHAKMPALLDSSSTKALNPKSNSTCLPHTSRQSGEVPKLDIQTNRTIEGPSAKSRAKLESHPGSTESLQVGRKKDAFSDDRHRSGHDRRLGQILYEDFKLLNWNENGVPWTEIINLFQMVSGKKRGRETLRKRCRQVQAALKTAGVSKHLIAQAVAGDEELIGQINMSVQDQRPGADQRAKGMSPNLSNSTNHRRIQNTLNVSAHGDYTFRPSPSNPEENLSNNRQPEKALNEPQPERLVTGGKTISWENLQHFIPSPNYDSSIEDQTFEQLADCQNEITEEDRCHFVYRVKRRDCTEEELENDVELEDADWVEYAQEYTSAARANAAAATLIYQSAGFIFADPADKFSVEHNPGEQGMNTFTLTTPKGIAQTRVTRSLRTFHEGIRPKSNTGMLCRTGYVVKWRVTERRVVDEVLQVSEELAEHDTINTVFTLVGIANEWAVSRYVDETFKSSNPNLTGRQQEKQQMIKKLLDTTGDESCFHKTSIDETGKKVEVWVESIPIKGPRNLY